MDSVKMESVQIKEDILEVEIDDMEPVKEESEDFKPNIPELEPVRLQECSVVLERICVREQGAGEEGSPNSTQGGGKEDWRSHSECSLAGTVQPDVPLYRSQADAVCRAMEFSGLASLPIKQELCEMQCDSSQPEDSEIKAEHNELEIPQTEEPLPVKQEEVLETVRIKQEPPEVEFDHMEPGKEESEDFKPNIPELEPVRLRECSVVLERICVREQGAGEEGSPNSMQGGGKEDGRSHSECSLAGE
ncbi:UNVERIFIED_CONTAM: hypothetical protein FKN15_026522 [Acipenser sinensis]